MSVNPNDPQTPPVAPPGPNPPATPPAPPVTPPVTGGDNQSPMIPKARLDEVLEENKRLKKAQEDRDKAEAKVAEDAAKQKGEYEKLYNEAKGQVAELEPLKAKVTTYETALTKYADEMKKDVPEHLLQLLTGMELPAQLEWLTANKDKVVTSQTPPRPGNAGGPSPLAAPKAGKEGDQQVKTELSVGGNYSRF
jgi:hypothetical protein